MSEPADCDCCAGTSSPAPPDGNRPGLDAIVYRAGTHATFWGAMLAGLTDVSRPELAALTTRDADDFSIALLDAWAVTADVLTFYQERIANESYLRTATELRSVVELARTIGYELRPGVAASTHLAFALEDAAGAPGYATVAAGTKVQSVPGPDEKPQTFETAEPLDARAAWNTLTPQPTRPVPIQRDDTDVLLVGTALNLRAGDALLLLDGSGHWDFRRVAGTELDHARGVTRVKWVGGVAWRNLNPVLSTRPEVSARRVLAFRQRASLFGHNAADWRAMSPDIRNHYLGPNDNDSGVEWPRFTLADVDAPAATGVGTGLTGSYFTGTNFDNFKLTRLDGPIDFDWTAAGPDPSVGTTNYSVMWLGSYRPAVSGTYVIRTESDDGVRLWFNGNLLIDEWHLQGGDGHEVKVTLNAGQMYSITLEYFQGPGAAVVRLLAGLGGNPPAAIPKSQLFPFQTVPAAQNLYLDALYPSILPDTPFVVSGPGGELLYVAAGAVASARHGFGLSAKTTRLKPTGDSLDAFDTSIREAVVYAAPEELVVAERPWADAVAGTTILLDRVLDGLPPGRLLVVRGTDAAGKRVGEAATLKAATVQTRPIAGDQRTQLELAAPLAGSYSRGTVTISANVAPATHGEGAAQVLGSGDAGAAYQQFTLRDAPLTYTPADDPSGGETTLEVRVNDLKWHEVPTLFGRGRRDRVYVTRRDADGRTAVRFGDGVTGARPPSGADNIRATYRKGIGHDGMLKADQLSLLMTRALGVRGVSNPLPTEGAQDPQELADARRNAPFTVLTLDRVVSLRDFEDFARAFSGVAKAHVARTWNGNARGVFLTVAGPAGEVLTDTGQTVTNLVSALQKAGDPRVPVRVVGHRPAKFRLSADVRVDPDARFEAVRAEVEAALGAAFGFDAREFGQGVAASEVVAAIAAVPGVVAVNLTRLYRTDSAPDLAAYLPAAAPADGSAAVGLRGAELLTPDDLGADIREWT